MSVYDLGKRRGAVRPSPLFLAFVALTAVGGALAWSETGFGSRFGDFGVLLFVLGGWIVSVCFHEFAHAYAAYRAGDRSVEAAGYLTLNPFKYAHPVLSILLAALLHHLRRHRPARRGRLPASARVPEQGLAQRGRSRRVR